MPVSTSNEPLSREIRRHRNIYRFGIPWARPLLMAVPWINAILLVLLLILVHGKTAVTPGVLFDLPNAPLREGTHATLTAMMIPVTGEALPGAQEVMVFFDDDRILSRDKEQMEALSERLRQYTMQSQEQALLLLADKRVLHGAVMQFINLARDAGIKRVDVATKPE